MQYFRSDNPSATTIEKNFNQNYCGQYGNDNNTSNKLWLHCTSISAGVNQSGPVEDTRSLSHCFYHQRKILTDDGGPGGGSLAGVVQEGVG